MSYHTTQNGKRFYIGTMFEYQLAKQYIQEGKGCAIHACMRDVEDFEIVAIWEAPPKASWSKQTQIALSKWFRLVMDAVPEVYFLVDTEGL